MTAAVSRRPIVATGESFAWGKLALLALAFVAIFYNNLLRLWLKTNPFFGGDPNWSHSMLVPVIGLYYLYLHRDELAATRSEPILPGVWTKIRLVAAVLIAAGLGVFVLSSKDVDQFGWLAVPGVVAMGIGAGLPVAVDRGNRVRNLVATLLAAGGVILYCFGEKLLPETQSLSNLRGALAVAGLGVVLLASFIQLLDCGLGTLVFGLLTSAYGIWPGQNDQVWDLGMIITLFGTVLTLGGWKVMRICWFPIVFLICMLPWPPIIYSAIASPLQFLAARVAVVVLKICGVGVDYAGTKIFIDVYDPNAAPGSIPKMITHTLNVEEACAGLRSLMTFITIAAAMAFLSPRPLWQRLVITASAVPIAIFCNVVRVSGQGLLDRYWSTEASQGFTHQFVGMAMLVPALLLIWMVMWIVDQLFLDVADKKPAVKQSAVIAAGGVA